MKRITFLSLVVSLLAVTAGSLQADIVTRIYKKDGSMTQGATRWLASKKQYVQTVKQGNVDMTVEIPISQVDRVQAVKPAKWDEIRKNVSSKNFGAAIPALEAIMKEYTMLQYDTEAGSYLARIYMAQNRPADAVRICQSLIATQPEAGTRSSLAPVYWKALLATGQGANLAPTLDEAVRTAPRNIAAQALIVRGDLLKEQGKVKEALADGYLRVVVLFANVEEAQPEALSKAAAAFDTLQQGQYAEKMRQQLLSRYSQSEEARKLRGR